VHFGGGCAACVRADQLQEERSRAAGAGKWACASDQYGRSGSSGDASGSDAWIARRAASDKNVSVGAGKSFAHITYKPT